MSPEAQFHGAFYLLILLVFTVVVLFLERRRYKRRADEFQDAWLNSERLCRERTDNASVEAYKRIQKDRERLILMLKRFSSEWDDNLDAALKSLRSERPDETFQNIRTEQP